ncbi:MAG: ABC transporter substrate-binding protein [Xanthobacteraceae bacterium]|nr:ABC transporter substrate-binding protein [Xanthobacteraceae bacterium]
MGLASKIAMLVVFWAMSAGAALAQQKITIGGTPNSGPATAMVAATEGIFQKHGLDATYTLITINPSIPPALLAGSLQIGIPTPTTFLQAVDGGLDLVVIAGVANNSKENPLQIVVRRDSPIKEPKDLAGKKFGVPGLNAVLHVMTRHWLVQQGVDPKSVNFVEAVFPVHGDMLRSGQIDAVITVDPFATTILSRGDGVLFANLMSSFPSGNPNQMYVTTRDYATKHTSVVTAFRAAIDDAAAFIAANPDKTRQDIGNVLKLPPPAIANLILPMVDTKVTKEQIAFWVDVMQKQNMLSHSIDPAKLLF